MGEGEVLPVSILLVDDRVENLTALRAILGDQPGYTLVEATSGSGALRALLGGEFSLILLDAFLPGMDGFELARIIKQRERTRDVPILFLTIRRAVVRVQLRYSRPWAIYGWPAASPTGLACIPQNAGGAFTCLPIPSNESGTGLIASSLTRKK